MSELLVAALLLGVILYFWGKRQPHHAAAKPAASSSPLETLQVGAVLTISHMGSNLDTFDVEVTAVHRYQQGSDSWQELEGNSVHGKTWIEIQRDDELCINVTRRKLSLAALGLAPYQLVEEPTAPIHCSYEKQPYSLTSFGEATFHRNGQGDGDVFLFWDFHCTAEDALPGAPHISVEQWGEGSYEASVHDRIQEHQVTILSAAKAA